MRFLLFPTIALLTSWPSIGSAATFYSDEADFIAATGITAAESFESFADTGGLTVALIDAPGFSIATGTDLNLGIIAQTFNEVHATDGTKTVLWAAFASNPSVTFTYHNPITEFGTMITDALDGGLPGAQLLFSTNGGDSTVIASGALPTGNEIFFGLIADAPLTQVTFTVTQMPGTGDGIGFDEVRPAGIPLPEPSPLLTGALMICAAIGYCLTRQGRAPPGTSSSAIGIQTASGHLPTRTSSSPRA